MNEKPDTGTEALLDGLKAVVQYARKDSPWAWSTMAAFDSLSVAEHYVADCEKNNPPWLYRMVELSEVSKP